MVRRNTKDLSRLVRIHTNWILFKMFGADVLTESELTELKDFKPSILNSSSNFVRDSYVLGRMKSVRKDKEYQTVYRVAKVDLKKPEDKTVGKMSQAAFLQVKAFITKALEKAFGNPNSKNAAAEWTKLLKTIFQIAKIQGILGAIKNKVSIYRHGQGPDSYVYVKPGPDACKDCKKLYLEANGNPKVFRLRDLGPPMGNLGNKSQSKRGGVHVTWVATVPPLHPSCGCILHYMPAGYTWKKGLLINPDIIKADGVRGDPTSSTVKPMGPATTAKVSGPASSPGAAAPGNVAGPGRPKDPGNLSMGTAKTSPIASNMKPQDRAAFGGAAPDPSNSGGGDDGLEPCPFGGGDDCVKNGGNGNKEHKAGGSVMKKHQEAIAAGAKPNVPQDAEQGGKSEQQPSVSPETIAAYNAQPHSIAQEADFLTAGEIAEAKPLNANKGVNESYRVSIVGDGEALMKYPTTTKSALLTGVDKHDLAGIARINSMTEEEAEQEFAAKGLAFPCKWTRPKGLDYKAEEGAHRVATAMGLGELYPTTRARDVKGTEDYSPGTVSMQAWRPDSKNISDKLYRLSRLEPNKFSGVNNNPAIRLMKILPEDKQAKAKETLSTITVMDLVMNNADRHWDNVMVSNDGDVFPIDHGLTFSSSYHDLRSDVGTDLENSGTPITINDDLKNRFDNMSLTDMERSMADAGLPDYAVAQTFLRMKYVAHLQATFGQVPMDRFRATSTSRQGDTYLRGNRISEWGAEPGKALGQAIDTQTTPTDLFHRFAKAYMAQMATNPATADDAKRLMAMRPIRHPESAAQHNDPWAGSDQVIDSYAANVGGYDMNNPPKVVQVAKPDYTPPPPPNPVIMPRKLDDQGQPIQAAPANPRAAVQNKLESLDMPGPGIAPPKKKLDFGPDADSLGLPIKRDEPVAEPARPKTGGARPGLMNLDEPGDMPRPKTGGARPSNIEPKIEPKVEEEPAGPKTGAERPSLKQSPGEAEPEPQGPRTGAERPSMKQPPSQDEEPQGPKTGAERPSLRQPPPAEEEDPNGPRTGANSPLAKRKLDKALPGLTVKNPTSQPIRLYLSEDLL